MNEGFERHLRELLATAAEPGPANGFASAVTGRIGRIRRRRRMIRVLGGCALLVMAVALTPAAVRMAGFAADSSAAATHSLGELVTSPLAFGLGILIVLAALLEQRTN